METKSSQGNFSYNRFLISLAFFLQFVDLTSVQDSWPSAQLLLSSSHWQNADLSLILVFTYIAMIWDKFFKTNNNEILSGKALTLLLRIGMLSTICLLPMRIFHTVLVNNGTPRFSASQILNHETRQQNKEWIDQLISGKVLPSRILVNDFIQPEGGLSWFGLRYVEHFRDTQIAPIQARVKTRNQPALHSFGPVMSVDPAFNCNTLDTADRLDFLSVTKFISQDDCNKTVINPSRMKFSLLPIVESNNEAAMTAVSSLLSDSTKQLKVVDVNRELYYISPRIFHEWYYNPDAPRSRLDPPSTLATTPCPFLEQDCINQLKLFKGSVTTAEPRFKLCKSNCIAHFEYSAEYSQKNFQLVLPISYDSVVVAFDVDSQKLQIENIYGLVGIDTFGVSSGKITFSIAPDLIMRLHAITPVLFLLLIFYNVLANLRYRGSQR